MSDLQVPGDIPPVEIGPSADDPQAVSEQNSLEHHAKKLDNGLRKWAGRGALGVAGALYMASLAAIILFLGLCPHYQAVDEEMWHIVAVTLVALFTVPTILLLAVLRSTKPAHEVEASAVPEWIGEKFVALVEKFTSESK